MQKVLSDTIRGKIKEEIRRSPYIGLLTDETVNITVDKKLIVYLRIMTSGGPKSIFHSNVTIHSGNVETVMNALIDTLVASDIEIDKVMGFGSDGASVMTGRLNGVALAASDATKRDKGVVNISEYRKDVNTIYNFYHFSAARMNRLRELNDALDNNDFRSLKEPCSVRWLSLSRAVTAINNSWAVLAVELEEESRPEKNNAVAKGLLLRVSSFKFVVTTKLLKDVLVLMNRLNLLFQRDTIDLSTIAPMVLSTIQSLQQLLETPYSSVHEAQFMDTFDRQTRTYHGVQLKHAAEVNIDAFVNGTRREFVEALIYNLQRRFEGDQITVLTSLDVLLNPRKLPQDRNELANFGIPEMEALCGHFGRDMGDDGEIHRAIINFEEL
ncbi:uncharacterized protein C17orf113-like, partial [Saccoglossus kowalevskii]|uniref:Uncharacterized protein KIAA1586-like n=1 Tax=Saccoglossus kowalevskii TaxID=10224 RepID=A0ABM0MPM5_SACKO